jgi:threonine dehydrogenase-like Zn-dependent dehydrogenase
MSRTMLAAVFKGNGRLDLEQRPVPQIQTDDDVILQVGGVGVCGSDLHILDVPPKHAARPGVILGHEFAGRVVEVGKNVTDLKQGDHVGVDQNPPCGKCEMCRMGLPNFCIPLFTNPYTKEPGWPYTPGQWWDGAMAEFVRVPAYYCYPLAKHVPMWQAAILEPIGCVVNGMSKINFQAGETAAILGGGPVGVIFTSLLKASGASKIIVSEPAPRRRQAASACGAHVVLDPTTEDVKERVLAETGGKGADVVVEAVGSMFPKTIELARVNGRVLLFGVDSSARGEVPQLAIVSKELQIFGVFLMKYTMPAAIKLIEAGLLPMSEIVTHRLPLEKVQEGIALARRGEAIKVVLTPNEF